MTPIYLLVFSVSKYKVWVYTGKEDGSDTDATVHLCLYGERGDTGKRVISYMEADHDEKFREGQVSFSAIWKSAFLYCYFLRKGFLH